MERRKDRRGRSNLDEVALAKAAAWAWYQRGTGAEGRPMREYDPSRAQKPLKPSRYKLETMKEDHIQHQDNPKLSSPLLSPLYRKISGGENSNISLLDTYEVERISRQLNYYIETSRSKSFLGGDNCGSEKMNKAKNNSNSKGFGLAVCGWRHDVVESTVQVRRRVSIGDSRRPEKNAAVVKAASCHTQGVHA